MAAKLHIRDRYAVTPNHLLTDPKISLKAKGLFAYIQSKPEGWRFSMLRIAKDNQEGETAVRSAMKELEEAGYLGRTKRRTKTGQWEHDYELISHPSVDYPTVDNPPVGNPPNNKERDTKQEIVNKSTTTATAAGGEIPKQAIEGKQWNEVIDAFKPVNPLFAEFYKRTGERTALLSMAEAWGYQKLLNTVRALETVCTKPYSPKITKPSELKRDIGKLVLFAKQHNIQVDPTSNEGPKKVTRPKLDERGNPVMVNGEVQTETVTVGG